MMYSDTRIAMPLSTMFGGTCCTPSALRSRPSTTTIFAYEVTTIAMNGTMLITSTAIKRPVMSLN